MLKRFNHVAIVVPDLDDASKKYKNVLRAKVSKPFDYLEHGQTDGLNSSLLDLKTSDDVFIKNMLWEKWDAHEFLDRNHLNIDGRQKMCGILAPVIDSILIG